MSDPNPTPAMRAAVDRAMRRLQAAWPGYRFSDDLEREHRLALTRIGDPDVIEEAVTEVIQATQERYPPPVGQVMAVARAVAERRPEPAKEARRGGPRFVQALCEWNDPPGTIRWAAIQPDGRIVPAGARLLRERDAV